MKKKILTGLGIIVLLLLLGTISSQARIVTNDPTVESGGTVTINVTSQEVVYGYKISISSNSGLTFKSVSGGEPKGSTVSNVSLSGTQSLATYTFTAPEVTQDTTYTVTFLGEGIILDSTANSLAPSSSATATVTVKAKQTSSEGGTTTGDNEGETQKPETPSTTTPSNNNTSTKNEPTFSDVNQTVYVHNTDSVNVRSGPGTSYSSLGRLARNTAITRTGVGSNGWSRVNYNGQTAYISSSYLTTTKPEEEEKSSNAMLSALTLDVEGLSPEFNKETDNYTLQVGEEIEKIDVTATPEDEKAIVTVEGNETLQVGENKITVTVTAEDGTAKVYTIIVNKGNIKQASLGLASFNIKGIDMEGVFSPTTYEYTIEINQDVSELEITAEPNEEGATVEIIGNGDLQEGENIVNIIVKSADGEETVTYQLTIQKNVTAVSNTSDQTQNMIFIGLFVGIIVIIIIVVSILLYRKHKRKIEEEYDFNDGEEENADFYNDNFKNTVEDDAEDIDQDTITQDYTDMLEEEEIEEEKPKRKKGKHF